VSTIECRAWENLDIAEVKNDNTPIYFKDSICAYARRGQEVSVDHYNATSDRIYFIVNDDNQKFGSDKVGLNIKASMLGDNTGPFGAKISESFSDFSQNQFSTATPTPNITQQPQTTTQTFTPSSTTITGGYSYRDLLETWDKLRNDKTIDPNESLHDWCQHMNTITGSYDYSEGVNDGLWVRFYTRCEQFVVTDSGKEVVFSVIVLILIVIGYFDPYIRQFLPTSYMPLDTDNREIQTASICRQHLRETFRDEADLVEKFILKTEGSKQNAANWQEYSDGSQHQQEMFKKLDLAFNAWLKGPPASTILESTPHGVGGWLLVLCILLTVVSPLFCFAELWRYQTDFQLLLNIVLILFSILTGILLWTGRRIGRQLAEIYFWIFLALAWLYVLFNNSPEQIGRAVAASIICPAWLLYLNKSKRVFNTYISNLETQLVKAEKASVGNLDLQLRTLAKLHEDGIITDDEFQRKKGKLLDI
jgi:hypothetical protein